MGTVEIILAVFFSICFASVYVYAVLLLCGIGGKALAGYHKSSNDTTAHKEHIHILRKAGACLLFIANIAHAMCLLFIFGEYIWGGVMVALLIVSAILSVFVLNSKKMRKKEIKVNESNPINKNDEEKNDE